MLIRKHITHPYVFGFHEQSRKTTLFMMFTMVYIHNHVMQPEWFRRMPMILC